MSSGSTTQTPKIPGNPLKVLNFAKIYCKCLKIKYRMLRSTKLNKYVIINTIRKKKVVCTVICKKINSIYYNQNICIYVKYNKTESNIKSG